VGGLLALFYKNDLPFTRFRSCGCRSILLQLNVKTDFFVSAGIRQDSSGHSTDQHEQTRREQKNSLPFHKTQPFCNPFVNAKEAPHVCWTLWNFGSEQESVKVRDLRGFLKSEVFGLGQWSTAASAKNGRNPRFRYGNDALADLSRLPTGSSRFLPRRLETRTQRGFPHFHSDDGCGVLTAMKMNSAKIAGLVRFLHRTGISKVRTDVNRNSCESTGDRSRERDCSRLLPRIRTGAS
jgi:hypothetical protein